MMTVKRLLGLSALAFLALSTVGTSWPASAQSVGPAPTGSALFGIKAEKFGQTTLEGGHFAYALTAGASVHDAIVLINYVDRALVFHLYPADMKSARGGALAPAQRDEKMRGVGAWLKLSDPELAVVSVPAKGRRSIPFALSVPEHTPPGDYPGAMVVSLDVGRSGTGFNVQTRAALMVRLTVRGEVEMRTAVSPLRFRAVEGGYAFDTAVSNAGNVLVTTKGTLELRRAGKVINRIPLNPSGMYVIPGGKADLRAVWKDPPALGRVKAVARVEAFVNREPSGVSSSPASTLTLVPMRFLGAALAVLGVVAGSWRITRRRRNAWLERRRSLRELLRDRSSNKPRVLWVDSALSSAAARGLPEDVRAMDWFGHEDRPPRAPSSMVSPKSAPEP